MTREFWRNRSRGRYPGSSQDDVKSLKYIAVLALKHNLDLKEFLSHIIEAWKKDNSRYEMINIECRQRKEDSAIFLLTLKEDVLAQFSLSKKNLEQNLQSHIIERIVQSVSSSRRSRARELKIEDLRVGMKNINLEAEILDIPEPNLVYTRYGTRSSVSNILIGDETGAIRMSLWNEYISQIHKGDTVRIEKGIVASFRGEPQLRIGRNGNLIIK
jgi:hypothetical protein